MYRKILKILEKTYLNFIKFFIKIYVNQKRVGRMTKIARYAEIQSTLKKNLKLQLETILQKQKLNYLDVGAGNIEEILHPFDTSILKYKSFFNNVLIEPIPSEYRLLKKDHQHVIQKIVSSKKGKVKLNILNHKSLSSTLDINGLFFKYYLDDFQKKKKKLIIDKVIFEDSTTIDEIEKELKLNFDLIKLDTQGNEYEILRSIKVSKPFIIKTEVSTGPIYKKQKLFYDIGSLLYKKGYILFNMSIANRPVPEVENFVKSGMNVSLGIPLHGDVFFMPDWTRKIGKKIIERNIRKWGALMLVFGQEQLLNYIIENYKLKSSSLIKSILN